MRDFDVERHVREEADRSIRIGGEVFTYKAAVAPEVVMRWNAAATGEIGELSEERWIELFDETILKILDHGQDERWRGVRDPAGRHPLNLADMKAVLTFLLEQATGRPTGPASGSSPGGAGTETTSRGESSSQAGTPSEPSPPDRPAT